MEFSVRECPICHSKDGSWNPQERSLFCRNCRKSFTFSRKEVNSDGGVKSSAMNAVLSFKDNKIEMAVQMAMDALEISYDYAPAKYIIAYNDEVIKKKIGPLNEFFTKMDGVELDSDEVEALMQLFLASPKRLVDFEETIIKIIATNYQSEKQIPKLLEFFDKLCPYFIANRTSYTFLTPSLAEMYEELASVCDIPKTCYSLYNAIVKIPDSPVVDNSFFLQTKCENFYNNFVLPIGKILGAMKTPEQRAKFSGAFETRRAQFKAKMG